MIPDTIPSSYRKDIEEAVRILTEEGCSQVFLFGSLAEDRGISESTDIDIAVKGLSSEKYFRVYGKLLMGLSHSVDLVVLDDRMPFGAYLDKNGVLKRVA